VHSLVRTVLLWMSGLDALVLNPEPQPPRREPRQAVRPCRGEWWAIVREHRVRHAVLAKELLERIKGEYDRAYYSGILAERRAKTKLAQNTPHSHFQAYDLFQEAMEWFEKAEKIRPPGNDDALLRWNTCQRIIARNKLVQREEEERVEFSIE
jgi:hypothetical protein